MAVASRGGEKISVTNQHRQGSVSTVPGDGGVKNDMPARNASERSAAHYTEPATRKMGG